MTLEPKRRKKCRACGEWFHAYNTLHRACSPRCAMDVVRMDAEKEQKRDTRRRKQTLKSKGELRKEAQTEFNAYIRERDLRKPCISCGRTPGQAYGGTMDAGHYRSTGSCPELRFSEWNCYAQCVYCNRHLSGNAIEFRIGLRQRIGDAALEWLEQEHPPTKYTKEDYRRIKAEYRAKRRELQKERDG